MAFGIKHQLHFGPIALLLDPFRPPFGLKLVDVELRTASTAVVSKNSITTEYADSQSVEDPALGQISERACRFGAGETPSMNVMKLMVVALAGWIDQQQEDVIEYLRELPRAAWRIALLLLPGCGMNTAIPIFGHYGCIPTEQ